MIPFLPTRTELAIRYKLNSDGLAVLSAVIFYCREAPHIWELNAHQMVRDVPYLKNHVKVGRYLKQLIQVGALKANGKIITLSDKLLPERNVPKLERNVPHIINNNINKKSSCLAGEAATPQPKQENFKVPSFEELLSYGRERGYTYAPMQAFYQYYSANGWTLKRGARMKCWQAALGFWMGREAKMAAARAATRGTPKIGRFFGEAPEMAQAGYRPENRSYEHKVAMSERARDEKAMEAAKAEAELQSDEERQATFDTIERLQAHFAASENSKRVRQSGRTD